MALTLIAESSMPVWAKPLMMSDGTVFDAEYYAQNNPDVAAVCGTDTAALYGHYQDYGKAEGRAPAEEGAQPVGSYVEAAKSAGSQTGQSKADQSGESKADQPQSVEDAALAQYYGESVFIGDSIMLGFRNYSARQTSFVHEIQFLAAGSYSAGNALKPVKGDNVHPKYKGKKCQVWDAVSQMGCKRAFVLLGMNDIAPLGLEGARDTYKELLTKIEEASPGIEIHIISVTYTLKDKGTKGLNNTNIAKYNELLQEMAQENGWGYIDLCTPLSDGKGNLAEKYCSDGFVHLSKAAYTAWEKELANYEKLETKAKEQTTPANQSGTKR